MKRLKQLPCYFIGIAAFLILTTILISTLSKTETFLMLNQYHPLWLDLFFSLLTHLGDGIFTLCLILILLTFRKRKKSLTLLLAYAYSSVVAQLLKNIFNLPRPRLYLEQLHIPYHHFVKGVPLHDLHAFPSGHTASAFATATVLVLVFKKKRISVLCMMLAIAVGYSRIYLAQHFPSDVLAGAIIGISLALLSYYQVYDLKLFRSKKAIKRLQQLRLSVKPSLS